MKTLIMTCGLPYSGKSTWAQEEAEQSAPIVCPDAIRLAMHGQRFAREAEPLVWAMARVMVRALFLGGHYYVILDSTANTKKRREEWRSKEWRREFIEMNADKDECIRRARAAGDEYIIPVIERMASEQEPVGEDERE